MQIIVADSNVFVYLFRANLLAKIFGRPNIEICIPEKIFEELTSGSRIPKEEPPLPEVIWKIRNDPNNQWGIKLKVIHINDLELSGAEVYCNLEDDGLDAGEREAIPLAIDLGGLFVSADELAIQVMKDLNAAAAKFFPDYCQELRTANIITAIEFTTLTQIIYS